VNTRFAYLDASAFVKAPLGEVHARALAAAADEWGMLASSALLRVEAVRACRRVGQPAVDAVTSALRRVVLIPVDDAVIDAAAQFDVPALRSLDAIHLATAIGLGDDLGMVFTYDTRLADAARALGIPVASPV